MNHDRVSEAATAENNTALLNVDRWNGKVFAGQWISTAMRIAVCEPATAEILGEVGESRPEDVAPVVALAQAAQPAWAAQSTDERAARLRRAALILERNDHSLLDAIVRETGGVRAKAEAELKGAVAELIHSAAILVNPEGHILPSHNPARLSLARRVPLGIVVVIAPWNFPLLLVVRKNSIVASEWPVVASSWSGVLLSIGLAHDVSIDLPCGNCSHRAAHAFAVDHHGMLRTSCIRRSSAFWCTCSLPESIRVWIAIQVARGKRTEVPDRR